MVAFELAVGSRSRVQCYAGSYRVYLVTGPNGATHAYDHSNSVQTGKKLSEAAKRTTKTQNLYSLCTTLTNWERRARNGVELLLRYQEILTRLENSIQPETSHEGFPDWPKPPWDSAT